MNTKMTKAIETLCEKAEFADDSTDAMKFSQSALNIANARACVLNVPESDVRESGGCD